MRLLFKDCVYDKFNNDLQLDELTNNFESYIDFLQDTLDNELNRIFNVNRILFLKHSKTMIIKFYYYNQLTNDYDSIELKSSKENILVIDKSYLINCDKFYLYEIENN